MAKINSRSPYFLFIDGTGNDYVQVDIYVYSGEQGEVGSGGDRPADPTYTIKATFLNNEANVNISELVNDYIETNFDGNYTQDVYWVDIIESMYLNGAVNGTPTETRFRGFKGYGYFEDGRQPQLQQNVLLSNTKILKLDDEALIVPVDTENTVRVSFEDESGDVYTTSVSSSTDSSEQIEYVSNVLTTSKSFESRVLSNGGVFERGQCLTEFDNQYSIFPTKSVYVEHSNGDIDFLRVENISECKYTPNKITFVNRFGAYQDLWFFKTSKLKMNVEDKSFRANTLVQGAYDTSKHQYKTLFKKGKQTLSLSSGFYPEEYNEVFKQLLLSEDVWINYENNTLPVNIKSSDMSFKTRLNDSLIEYNIELEFAYDTINSVR